MPENVDLLPGPRAERLKHSERVAVVLLGQLAGGTRTVHEVEELIATFVPAVLLGLFRERYSPRLQKRRRGYPVVHRTQDISIRVRHFFVDHVRDLSSARKGGVQRPAPALAGLRQRQVHAARKQVRVEETKVIVG